MLHELDRRLLDEEICGVGIHLIRLLLNPSIFANKSFYSCSKMSGHSSRNFPIRKA